ncbi:MAG: M23 family metallopeptidase, partial [Bacteroidia bacterium]
MKWFSSALLFVFPVLMYAHSEQTNYPKNYFQTPIDAPLLLAGNFGELRPNHFHAGIDITTQGKEGIAIFAAAEGYVSRIRISPFGYGKALYITHPNGYTTVYGHLRNFNKDIGMYAERNQYEAELFEIDITVPPGALPVKKGEIIARSGNTGGSGGPHLHFEIRDTKTEDALNPLLFGLPVADKVAPTIVRVAIIPLDANARVNGKNQKKYIALKSLKGIFVPATAADTLPRISGRIGFAVDAYDKESTPHGKNGVYGIRLSINGSDVYA